MAPGVGKTYRMLQEGRAEADSGRDTVIGYLEPHGREETRRAGARGSRSSRGARSSTAARRWRRWICRRCSRAAPELCLIDELAHTNAPGVEHEKRYEDVRDVLDAGIDVFSTVNVQHLESLNDQVARLTGATRARDDPRRGPLGGRRGRADRPDARGADRAAAGRQGVPARARAGGAQQLLQDREPLGAARDRAAPGRRGRRGQAARARDAGRRPPRRGGAAAGRGRRPRRRSPSGCWRS